MYSTRYFCPILINLNFLDRFSKKKNHISNIRPVGTYEDRQADRWAYITKLIVAFRHFAKTPKNDVAICNVNFNFMYLNDQKIVA